MRRLSILTAILLTIFTPSRGESGDGGEIPIPSTSKQLIEVISPSWNSREATLQRYERVETDWVKVGEAIAVVLGRNGLGWGIGLHTTPRGAKYIKREGDGRSPAGLFSLSHSFGYSEFGIDFPYRVYTRKDRCVDDSGSRWYNRIIDSTKVKKDYSSFEYMRLKGIEYKYGVVVDHNREQIAGGGSCIFIHIDGSRGRGTAGCTAMGESNMVKLLKWLRRDANPLLLQLPKSELERVKF